MTTTVLDLRRDMFPISQEDSLVHETTISTTSVLDPRMGPTPYLPKKEFSLVHETAIDRVLRYSILGRDKFPISKNLVIQEMTIHRLLRTRLSEDSILLIPRKNPTSSRQQLVDYDSTRPKRDELSVKGTIAREDLPITTALDKKIHPSTRQEKPRLLQYSSNYGTRSPFHKRKHSTTTVLEDASQ